MSGKGALGSASADVMIHLAHMVSADPALVAKEVLPSSYIDRVREHADRMEDLGDYSREACVHLATLAILAVVQHGR